MSLIYDDEYEPANDSDLTMLLNDIPYDLTKANIMKQVNDPLSTTVDYLDTFLERCNYLIEKYDGDSDAINDVKNLKLNMCRDILEVIDNKFGFDFDIENMQDNELEESTDVVYRFLIIGFKKRITKYVYKFIKQNKKTFSDTYADQVLKKDVSTLSMKKRTKDKDAVVIIACLPNIVKDVLSMDCENEDFLEMVVSEDSYEGEIIANMCYANKITGNFVSKYFSYILEENESMLEEVYIKVHSKLLSKLELSKEDLSDE